MKPGGAEQADSSGRLEPVDPEDPEAEGPPSLDALRRTVARMEGRIEPAARLEGRGAVISGQGGSRPGRQAPSGLRLGVAAFDGLFPAGLPLDAVTELRVVETRHAGALTGFAVALVTLVGRLRHGPVLWVRERAVLREAGGAAGLGLLHLGLDPARLLVASVRDAGEALWAAEEGLGCPGLSAVVLEVHGLPRALDLTASRRLALRAREGGLPALVLGHAMPEAASAAAVRLALSPRLSRPVDGFAGGPGFPAWTVVVEKNRDGRTGRFDMEWNSDDRCFRVLPPVPVDLASDAADGPARPPALGQVLAHPAAVRRAS